LIVERAGELVTVPEIAARIGLSAGRVHELSRDGELPASLGRIGGIQVWEWAAVEAKLTATRGLAPKRRGPKPRSRSA
jgi:predicted DNA-binding transcriptional regulator AlpA